MYTYAEIANANLIASEIIAKLKNAALEISKEYPEQIELMHTLAITDTLEEDWSRGRYLSFMRKLHDLHWYLPERCCGRPLLDSISYALNKLNETNLLFEVMSSRSDASFNETSNLFKFGMLMEELRYAFELFDGPDSALPDFEDFDPEPGEPDFGKLMMCLCPSEYNFDSKLRAQVGFMWFAGGPDSIICFDDKLLGTMSKAIELADYLLEYEEAVATAGIEDRDLLDGVEELHKAFQEVGAFDRWRKF